jgi:hypothetical protein
METIVLILNRKNTGPHFGYQVLASEFGKLGFHTIILEAAQENFTEEFAAVHRRHKVAFTLTHNNLKADLRIDGEPFFEKFDSWCISLVDSPYSKYELVKNAGDRVAMLVGDVTNKKLVHEVNPRISVFEWIAYNNVYEDVPLKPIAVRSIDVMFAGRVGIGEEALDEHGALRRFFAKRISRNYGFQNELQVEEVMAAEIKKPFGALLNKLGVRLDFAAEETWDYLWHTVQFTRAARRNFVLRELMSLPETVNVTIITDKDHAKRLQAMKKKNVTVHEFMPWPDVIAMMRDAKLAINVMPFQVRSNHERIATSQYNGAAVLTDTNPWLRENYIENEDLFFYLYKRSDLANRITSLLAKNPSDLQKVADKGSQKVRKFHMPANRAEYIIGIYRTMKAKHEKDPEPAASFPAE